jgi:VIT1/CCC1 family predicted Fe2+/Mn2+ transporter
VDRINEVLFGLIMVLTFTCSISAATAGHEELSTVLWSALGCNIAWGFVDAVMYLFSVLLERGETYAVIREVRSGSSADYKKSLREAMPDFVAHVIQDRHLEEIAGEIKKLPEPPPRAVFRLRDLRQAAGIFLLVFLSTFPVTLPFLLIDRVTLAMRISNVVALALLFITGVYLARQTGRSMITTGIVFAMIGFLLVSITIALGG